MYDGFYFDSFFDIPNQALPQNCEYYFNILVISIAVPVGTLEGVESIDDLSRIKNARPLYLSIYESEECKKDWEISVYPHSVVEVNTKTNEVSWYDMIDFETERPWAIEPIEEDFDYEEDDDYDPEEY